MSIFTVSIQDRAGSWRTPPVSDVTYSRDTSGNRTAQFVVDDGAALAGIGPDCKVRITDRYAHLLWTGSVGIPGMVADGEWVAGSAIGCFGNLAALSAQTHPFPYVVTALDAWERDPRHPSRFDAVAEAGSRPESPDWQGLLLAFPQGPIIPTNRSRMRCIAFEESPGWYVGAVSGSTVAGVTTAATWYRTRMYIGDAGFQKWLLNRLGNTTPAGFSAVLDGTPDLPWNQNQLSVEWRFDSETGNSVTTDNDWTLWYGLRVLAQRKDASGATVAGMSAYSVTASEIVADVLGRLLPTTADLGASEWEGSTAQLASLDYRTQPATIAGLLDDLADIEGGWVWTWGHEDTNGRAPLTFRAWPTTPRYLLPAVPGVTATESAGSDASLCDRVTLRWRDAAGRLKRKTFVADRAQYTDLERMPATGRAYPDVTLDATVTAIPIVDRIGAGILDLAACRADTCTVDLAAGVQVTDTSSGAVIDPHVIEPGHLAYVQSLGRAVRVTGVDVSEDAVRLTCGTQRRDPAQIIGDAQRRRNRR